MTIDEPIRMRELGAARAGSSTANPTLTWQARIDLLDPDRNINALCRSAEQDDKR